VAAAAFVKVAMKKLGSSRRVGGGERGCSGFVGSADDLEDQVRAGFINGKMANLIGASYLRSLIQETPPW